MERKYPFIDADSTVLGVGRFRGGNAVLADVAPQAAETYRLIVAPVQVVDPEGEEKQLTGTIRGWFHHRLPVADFLAEYSRLGGTHHLALVYGDVAEEVAGFGEFMGWEVARV